MKDLVPLVIALILTFGLVYWVSRPGEVEKWNIDIHVTYWNGDEAVIKYRDVYDDRFRLDEGDLMWHIGSRVILSGVRSYWVEKESYLVIE